MRHRHQNDPEYLNLLLNDRCVLFAARREAIPSLHQSNLNPARYGRLHIALPLFSEQAAIVRFLKTEMADQEAAIERAGREISLLREYRTRLIADVVTGKVDVREAARQLLDEADEFELREGMEEAIDADEYAEDGTDDASAFIRQRSLSR
jgi:type I restriction enzyme S subunit